uniref:Uncharacterized protein n=1 Tax=Setaria viridis TaxID=4556 RepID=A0A4U6W566_SETVI|nr:hypothetical protein SEVIR_2G182301v2 [Setaria viridis]
MRWGETTGFSPDPVRRLGAVAAGRPLLHALSRTPSPPTSPLPQPRLLRAGCSRRRARARALAAASSPDGLRSRSHNGLTHLPLPPPRRPPTTPRPRRTTPWGPGIRRYTLYTPVCACLLGPPRRGPPPARKEQARRGGSRFWRASVCAC